MSAYEASTAKMFCPDGKNYLMKVLIDASVFPKCSLNAVILAYRFG